MTNSGLLWIFPKQDSSLASSFVSEFNIHPVMAKILISRGYRKKQDIHRFLYAKLSHLHPPDLLLDMGKAVSRIYTALKNQEKILIVGDRDADGITGSALLVDFFKTLGTKVFFYIPQRSLNREDILVDAAIYAEEQKCSLMITVDCGITAGLKMHMLQNKNIDLIITDHHEPTEKVPNCIATLNPKLCHSSYPNRELTGVGVAFKLAHAIMNFLVTKGDIQSDLIDLKRYLDLVALGIIADMGGLTGENRILVKYGLQHLKKTHRVGLLKLIHVSEVNPEEITTTDVASKITPRINSLGRIGDPRKGVELLLLRDVQEAEALAKELDALNQQRKRIERRDSDDVKKHLQRHPEILHHKGIFLSSHKWHPGTIAILAARLAKQYHRPTIIITIENSVGKASMRTISECPILPILKQFSYFLINYGGHDFAAGFTIEEQNIPKFKKSFLQSIDEKLNNLDIAPKLYLDAEVSFKDLTFEFLEFLNLFEPYGVENPRVILYTVAKQMFYPKIIGKKNLKFFLEENGRCLEGIGFHMSHRQDALMKKDLQLLIAFTPQVNVYFNKASIQLQIIDFKILDKEASLSSKMHPSNNFLDPLKG